MRGRKGDREEEEEEEEHITLGRVGDENIGEPPLTEARAKLQHFAI